MRLDDAFSECRRVFPAILVDREFAQAFLPPGYDAADANDFFHLGAPPSGQAVVMVSMMSCVQSQQYSGPAGEAGVGIYIQAPKLDGVEAAPENVYELERGSTAGPPAEMLRGLGWNVMSADIEVAGSESPYGQGFATATNGSWSLAVDVPIAMAPDSFAIDIRWWQQTDSGTGYFDRKFVVDGMMGAGICRFSAATLASTLVEGPTCPPSTLFMVGPPFDVEGNFTFHRGIRVTA